MSFDPSRHNFAGLGSKKANESYDPQPEVKSECCGAAITPQCISFEGQVYEEGSCVECGDLVCAGCGGPLDSDAVAI